MIFLVEANRKPIAKLGRKVRTAAQGDGVAAASYDSFMGKQGFIQERRNCTRRMEKMGT